MPAQQRLLCGVGSWSVSRRHFTSFKSTDEPSILFLVSALVQLALGKHHQKERRFGPSPANGYTRGTGVKFWQRRKNKGLRDPEMAAPGAIPGSRLSHETGFTSSTAGAHDTATFDHPSKPLTGGYHTAPTGTYATNY